jgi:hypothetical protein
VVAAADVAAVVAAAVVSVAAAVVGVGGTVVGIKVAVGAGLQAAPTKARIKRLQITKGRILIITHHSPFRRLSEKAVDAWSLIVRCKATAQKNAEKN